MINIPTGSPAPFRLQLDDGVTNRFVRATIYDSTNSIIGTVDLTHLVNGMYVGQKIFTDPGYYNVVYTVYLNNDFTGIDPYYCASSETFYAKDDSQSVESIADAVWAKNLSSFNDPGSAGLLLKELYESNDPDAFANLIWDAPVSEHMLNGTFGLFISVIRQSTLGIVNDLASGSIGLNAIKQEVINRSNAVIAEVNQNESKIDLIIPVIDSAKSAIIAQVDENQILIENVASNAALNKNQIISEINQNEAKIDQAIGKVDALTNNTTARFIVPELLIKPESGLKSYQFHLRLFDSENNPEAPDTAPRIRIRDLSSGTDLVSNVPMIQDGTKVGAYYYDHTISSATATVPLLVEATVVELGKTRYIPSVTEVTEYGADLDAIQSQLSVVDGKVSDTQTKINNGVFGLQAIKNSIASVGDEVLTNRTLIQSIKIKTDALPANVATQADIAGVNTAISALPHMVDIANALELVRSAIMGPTNKSNTDVYNHFDTSDLLKTNDPRLLNLDAKVSTRSTMTAAEVWSYASRTLTSVAISTADMRKIWEVLVSDISTAGSFGRLFQDVLDAKVSSRSTVSQVQTLLSGVAQQTTLNQATSQIISEIDANEVKISTVLNLLNAIKPQTDKIVNAGATETNVTNTASALTSLISNIGLIINGIKLKTDTIPSDPARESTVSARPVNPLLTNDSRLLNLDAKVSTRSTLTLAQLNDLVTNAEMDITEARLTDKINAVKASIEALYTLTSDIPTNAEFAYKVDPLSTALQLSQVASAILNAIGSITTGGSGGGGISAADVWNYANRSLTAPVAITTAQFNEIAKTADAQYEHEISTIYNNGQQEVMVWSKKNGQKIIGTNCSIAIKDADGENIWGASSTTANEGGVFKFSSPIALASNKNYMVIITATVDGAPRTTQQSFFTVG